MKNILIVAGREFRQIMAMRSFWLTLLILPIAFAIGPIAQRLLRDDTASKVMLVDRTGGSVAGAIAQRIERDEQREVLTALSRYVRRHHLEGADPAAAWAQHDRWYSDADLAAFAAAGGLPAAEARIARVRAEGIPDFKAPKPRFAIVAPAQAIAGAPENRLDPLANAALKAQGETPRAADYVVVIPDTFGATPVVRLWANTQPSQQLVAALQSVLTETLRTRYLQGQGVGDDTARNASLVAPALAISTPPPGGGAREAVMVRSILPLVATYLLMMSLMLSGSWMLQGTVEERSNKLLETVLACVSPDELMYGKLLGTVGIGLFMIAVWVACGIFAGYATQGAIADLIRPALDPLSSPFTILALLYFFVVGYVTISVMFLAIGAMSDSMRDAQGYLMPVILVILLPITFLMQAVIAGRSGGMLVEVMTWVPIWTPFAVLARLGIGIPAWQVIASGITLAAFTALELYLLGRLFRASLLATGQRPTIKEMVARMRSAG